MLLFAIIGWFMLSFVVASAARQRGFSGLGWFLFSISFSPLIAGFSLVLFPARPSVDDRALHEIVRASRQLTHAVNGSHGAIIEKELQLTGPSHIEPEQTWPSDPTWKQMLEEDQIEPCQKISVGGWILLTVVLEPD
jgi:hypothetical protein